MKKKKVAIVGATGVVGRTILKVLEEENINNIEYILFASKKSAGQKIMFMNKYYKIKELKENSFNKKIDYAIFSAGAETSIKFSPIAVSKGTIVIDNSSAFRMDNDVPLVVPEVNPEDIKNHNGIIANPNCSTIQAVVPLKILDDNYKIKRIVYSTYQAVSGAGRYGIEDLENGIEDYYKNNWYEKARINEKVATKYDLKKFKYPIFNNVLPQIDIFMDNGYSKEEMKMINETRKILKNPDLNVTATCARVPIFNSHAESINVEFKNNFDIEELIKLLKNAKGIKVIDDIKNERYPLSTNTTGTNDIYVGRIRRDNSVKYGINMWVVADNIRKGAATNAIQILEKLMEL